MALNPDVEPPSRVQEHVPSDVAGDQWVVDAVAAAESSITKLLNEFCVQPFIHRVEHSLHIRLAQLLGEWEHLRGLYPIGDSEFRTQLIHKEWPEATPRKKGDTAVDRRRGNVDLAVLAPRQLAQASLDQFIDGRIDAPIVIELGLDYTYEHFTEDLKKLRNSKVDHAYLVHLSRVQSADNAQTEAVIDEAVKEARRDGIKIAYARHDRLLGGVFVKHLDDSSITGRGVSLPEAAAMPLAGYDQLLSGGSR